MRSGQLAGDNMIISDTTIQALKWDEHGLLPVIVQDVHSQRVLMMAYMNQDALQKTLVSGESVFWSRSRKKLWHKGETSGNIQRVVEIRVDCDADTLLLLVEPAGPVCHTGQDVCFYRTLNEFAENPVRE